MHITSPNDVHAAQARAAIAAGKHVICEKPLGVDAAETAELVALAAAAGVVNAVCFNAPLLPAQPDTPRPSCGPARSVNPA